MTKKEKVKEDLLKNPQTVKLSEIIALLESEGYELRKPSGWSHHKLLHLASGTSIPLLIHNWEVKEVYKTMIKKFYLKNQQEWQKKQESSSQ